MAGRIPEFDLSDRLRLARRTAGLEQAELAERLFISRHTVVKYENGDYPKSGRQSAHLARRIDLWAKETGVDARWLRYGAEPDA